MKHHAKIVGIGKDLTTNEIKQVIDGVTVFEMLDSHGLPLWACIVKLKEMNLAFDVLSFMHAAQESGNYSRERLFRLFEENQPQHQDYMAKINACLDIVFKAPELHSAEPCQHWPPILPG